jgi:repressor LexA
MDPTETQQRILNHIRSFWNIHGYAPAVRDLMSLCGFRSPRAISFHLDKLERNGWIQRDTKARSIRLVRRPESAIPVFGAVPAGPASAQDEVVLGEVEIPEPGLSNDGRFALRVQGDSMIDAGIHHGDVAIVERRSARDNDIVVALVDGQTTLKRLIRNGEQFALKAENPRYSDIMPGESLEIQGVVTGIYRKL